MWRGGCSVEGSSTGYCARCGRELERLEGVGGPIGRCKHGARTVVVPLVDSPDLAGRSHLSPPRKRRKGADPTQSTLELP